MIIIKFSGGLGNQLFQYALGRKLAILNHDDIKFDLSAYQDVDKVSGIKRIFAIDKFHTMGQVASAVEIEKIKNPFGLFSKINRFIKKKLLRQFNLTYSPQILNQKGDIYLDGFWQSPLFFSDIREQLITELKLKDPLTNEAQILLKQIESTNSVAIHVRRGDYIDKQRIKREFGPCSTHYFKQAVINLAEKINLPHFFIFSDDLAWSRENIIINSPHTFVTLEATNSALELFLMSRCQHQIISNSTFSWWAAWLNSNPTKTVYAPTPWFDKVPYDKNLIPSSWLQIQK